jgi:hypothetical protein
MRRHVLSDLSTELIWVCRSQIREAQETLCDEVERLEYDSRYHEIRSQWERYRRWQRLQEKKVELEKILEERKAAQREEIRRAAEQEAVRQAREEQEQRAKERLRQEREMEAEKRSKDVAKRARQEQYRVARERLQKLAEEEAREREREDMQWAEKKREEAAAKWCREQMERQAQVRSELAAKKARERQEQMAKERLAELQMRERQDAIRDKWAHLKQQAEQPSSCAHPSIGWPRKNGPTSCRFCGKTCVKYSFRCPECGIAACATCKTRRDRTM